MNPKTLSIATACALCMGLIAILLKLSLSGAFLAGLCCAIFFMAFWRMGRGLKTAEDSYKTNETLFEQKVVGVISSIIAAFGIGLTYILVDHVLDFQSSGLGRSSADPFRKESLILECSKRVGSTTVKFWIFFSVIAISWSLARRYLVRERWHDL